MFPKHSETIILKGSERFLFQKDGVFMMVHNEKASVILGVQWGGG